MFTLNCRGRLLVMDKPVVMGIINCTPDSFYSGSRHQGSAAILAAAEKMIAEGATFLDLGGQSTRPGAEPVAADEEASRVIPAITDILRRFPEVLLSVDTYHSRVAREALAAGACIINDVSGGRFDPDLLPLAAAAGAPYVCMHMKGVPATMQRHTEYDDVALDVLDYFIRRIPVCREAGVHDVIIDPGFGFGKNIPQNFELLRQLSLFKMLETPVLVGLSRKSTIYRTLAVSPEEALNGSTVLHTVALLNGASILRVHDVREAMECVRLLGALGEKV